MAGSSTKFRQQQITGSSDMSVATVTAITVDSTMLSASNLQQDMNNLRKIVEDIKGTTNWYDAASSATPTFSTLTAGTITANTRFRPDADSGADLGASGIAFANLYVDAIDLNGQGSISIGGTGRIDLDTGDTVSVRSQGATDITFEVNGNDEIRMNATSIYPATADGSALGSTSGEWSDLYLADGGVSYFGSDQDVQLSHVADTGLLLSGSANIQLQFRDSALVIHSSVDGQLDIDADAELEITAPIVDINASTSVNISNDLKLDSDAAVLSLGAGDDVTITHDNGTGGTLAASGKVDITAGAASTWHASSGDLTIGGASQANAIIIKSTEAAVDAIALTASAGGIAANLGDAAGTYGFIVKDNADQTQFSINSAGVGYFDGNLQVNGNNIADSSGNAAFTFDGSANVRVNGNLEVAGTSITSDVTNLLVEDPIVLIGSGAASSNANGGLALASGSSVANQSLVFGRVANDVWGAGRKDVTNGSVTTLADMTLVDIRASKFQIDGASDYLDVSTDLQIVAAADVAINAGGGNVKPSANDGSALGVAGTAWSDLFLAEGGVINWDSGDVTLTQTGNSLAVDGGTFNQNDTTEATSTTDGSLQTDGGLSVAKSAVIGDDLDLLSNAAIFKVGSDQPFTLTHSNASNTLMASANHRLAFGDANDYIAGTGTDLQIISSGDLDITATLVDVTGAGTFSGVLKTDDATEATSTTDGSLQTDGGLSVAKSAVIGDDLDLLSDSAIINIGSTSKFTLTDQAANNCVMATANHRLAFGNAGEYITGDGTDLSVVSSGDVKFTAGIVMPSSNNGSSLGIGNGGEWSDLFLAEGGVINWDNGDVTITHSSNTLTVDAGSIFIATNISGSLTKLDDGSDYIIAGSGIDITTGSSGELTISTPSGEIKRSRNFYTVTASHANGQNLTLDTESGRTGFTNATAQNNPYDALDVYLNGQYMRSGTSAANGDYTVSPEFAVASDSFGAADIVFFFTLESGDVVTTFEHDRA